MPTKLEAFFNRLKNNRFLWIPIAAGVVIIALATLGESVQKLASLFTRVTTTLGSSTSSGELLDYPGVRDSAYRRLAARIGSAQRQGGDFAADPLDVATSFSDVWTTAQSMAALSAATSYVTTPVRLEPTLAFLARQAQECGWPLTAGEPASTEVTAWVGIALLETLKAPDVWTTPDQRREASALLNKAYACIMSRQHDLGAWPSYPIRPRAERRMGVYATYMAMELLLALRTAGEVSFSSDSLELAIKRGLSWIIRSYDPGLGGWTDYDHTALEADLSTLFVLVMAQASRQGLLAERQPFQATRTAWVRQALRDAGQRSIAQNTRVNQPFETSRDSTIHYNIVAATVVWYPSSILLACELLRSPDVAQGLRDSTIALLNQLHARLSIAIDSIGVRATFTSAELLLALAGTQGVRPR